MSTELQPMSLSRPRLWRWIVGTIAIVVAWQILGFALTAAFARFFDYDLELLFSVDDADLAKVRELPAWSTGATVLISFVPLLIATMIAYRYLLKRPLKQLFTSAEKYSWRKTWIGFAALSVINLVFGLADFIVNNGDYTWSWDASAFLPSLLICLTLLPLQTTAEELFFRGWLQQWLDNGKKKLWTVSLFNGALFALPHLANPEVAGNQIYLPVISYGATGFMFAWVTYRDKGLELAIGAHFANNFLTGLLVSTADSALPSVSLYMTPDVAWGPAAVISVVMVPIFIWLTKKWSAKVSA